MIKWNINWKITIYQKAISNEFKRLVKLRCVEILQKEKNINHYFVSYKISKQNFKMFSSIGIY